MTPDQRRHSSILLIDGDDRSREYYAQRLGRCDSAYRILQARDGRSGLELYDTQHIDCVIVDLDLPDMSGFQILLKLVRNTQRPEVAVIVISLLKNPVLKEVARKEGAQDYLRKTWLSGGELDGAIQKALAAVGYQREGSGPADNR